MNILRRQLETSGLTTEDFAAQIGVDLARLQYWLELESYRAAVSEVERAHSLASSLYDHSIRPV